MGQQWERSLFCQFQLLGSHWEVHWLKLTPGLNRVLGGKTTPPNIFFRPILPKFEEIFEIVVGDFERWPMLPVRKTTPLFGLSLSTPTPTPLTHTHTHTFFFLILSLSCPSICLVLAVYLSAPPYSSTTWGFLYFDFFVFNFVLLILLLPSTLPPALWLNFHHIHSIQHHGSRPVLQSWFFCTTLAHAPQ